MKNFTLVAVAKAAGVGRATVDRVLNDRGGVSPETTRRVLKAAREAGVNRILPQEHKNPWRIEVILSSHDAFFFNKLAEEFSDVATSLGYRRLQLHRTLMAESQPEKLAQHIIDCCNRRDGLIVFAHNHPAVHDALAYCQTKNVPVITIVTDIPHAQRLCHVGINQYQAGRTAGLLMAKMLNGPGEVMMVSGHFDYSAHRQRIAGFKEALLKHAPQVTLAEALAGQDNSVTLRKLLEQNLIKNNKIIGIYNTGDVNAEVSEALARHQLSGKCIYMTHELYDLTRKLLVEGVLTLTFDQNAKQHAQLAVGLLLRRLEDNMQPDIYADGMVDFRIVSAENVS